MPTTDPLLQGNVLLDIDGVGVVANFTSVSGVSSEVEIVDNPFVNDQGKVIIHKLPGKPKTPDDHPQARPHRTRPRLWDWHSAVMQGNAGPPQRLGDPHEHHRRGGPPLQLHQRDGLQDQPLRRRRHDQRRPDRGGDRWPARRSSRARPVTTGRAPARARRPSASARARPTPCGPSSRSCCPAATSTAPAPSIARASCASRRRATRSSPSATRASARTRRTSRSCCCPGS